MFTKLIQIQHNISLADPKIHLEMQGIKNNRS